MKNSWYVGINAAFLFGMIVLGIPHGANSQAYYRVENFTQTPAPKANSEQNNLPMQVNSNYAYGYVYNLPEDGNWRYINEHCYQSAKGQTCVEGHWVKKQKGKCEEVTAHTIRTGNYIKLIPNGKVSSCKP